uniref:Uncharacterized protein n=1 Tax=Mycena chlorophos TaxID=658473 RepID=A0ABQ0LB81_MYCCL|nr:predicted protein [Mycena chlorophos]
MRASNLSLLVAVNWMTLVASTSIANGTGTVFYMTPGIGACGYTNSSTDLVASVSNVTFKAVRGATANPNDNPICNKTIYLRMPHTSGPVAFSVVDYFPIGNSVGPDDVGIPKYYFQRYAPVDEGIIPNVSWSIMST